jgi:hypothetical protein
LPTIHSSFSCSEGIQRLANITERYATVLLFQTETQIGFSILFSELAVFIWALRYMIFNVRKQQISTLEATTICLTRTPVGIEISVSHQWFGRNEAIFGHKLIKLVLSSIKCGMND